MSYILEALKKAERQRGKRGLEHSVVFSLEDIKKRRGTSIWPHMLFVGLFLNAVVLFLLFGPFEWNRNEMLKAAQNMKNNHYEVMDKYIEKIAEGQSFKKSDNKAALITPDKRISASIESTIKTVIPTSDTSSVQTIAPFNSETPIGEKGKLYLLDELPSSIKSVLPDFRISGHAYSEERRTRVVRINEKILLEGQYLLPELKLEEITPDGVVFHYKDIRFLVKIR